MNLAQSLTLAVALYAILFLPVRYLLKKGGLW